jgi:predicted nucleic acid-binding protein
MRVAFADAFYFLALLDSAEERHVQAVEAAQDQGIRLVTTEWVLTEIWRRLLPSE